MRTPRHFWKTTAVVAAGLSGALALQSMNGRQQAGDGPSADKPGPVTSRAETSALRVSGDGTSASLGKRDTEPFSMLGVTWSDPSAHVGGRVEVRTRQAGTQVWSRWMKLDGDSGQGESGARRGGTEPAWVGPSDGVEVRVDGKGAGRLPKGLRLDMVDPGSGEITALEPAAYSRDGGATPEPPVAEPEQGTDPGDEPQPDGTASEPPVSEPPVSEPEVPDPSSPEPSSGPQEPIPSPSGPSAPSSPGPSVSVPPAPPSTTPVPPITSRAGWGADESISPEEPGYLPDGRVEAVVVHHTAESNDYTCAQGPAVVRGIYAYHVKQLGWKDVGYNFLVDKCGIVYEGRKGGVDRPVMGAHAYGFNAQTTGISVLGTYTAAAPSTAALTSVARIAAWKLGQYGVDPAGTVTLTAGDSGRSYYGKTWAKGARLSLPAIHGHRDGYNTQCPGDAFYDKLPTLRAWAGGPVSGLTLKSVTGAGTAGTTTYTKSAVTVNWSATTPAPLIARYELLVNGKVAATTAGTATSAKATLAAGTHKVAVRAVHQSGATATTTATTVVAETTAPAFPTKPNLALRTGTVDTAAVPLTLKWKATDGAALKEVRLTAPTAKTYGPTVTSANHTAKSATATKWSLSAYDQAGNTATASVTGTPVILQESSAAKTGTWSTKSSSSYLGGKSYTSSTKNASLTWTFTGRSVAWTVSRAATSGQADIYVDGKKVTTVDLKSATTKYRDAIWTKTWDTSAKHTVKIVVVGTSGRPAVTTDGLVYLK
ncbi:N-acetylmuramoyl-L-alanine amidase [Streptomyces tagetis]|uniref:N-acetylmuramoyl-L-alanine amidase n=1 Tax=Streptomyces tagetis TaxID=2820809 RepID=A0A940XS76_9ACTN|nr:N-acetylmuramoyl-L-alanine amidase [Streptomyces sp. RG38]MBQ0830225.1 N-acetylmuramoyl-L-alanine amidase [Streptomyces sp. RG38]